MQGKFRDKKDIVLSFNGGINKIIRLVSCKVVNEADLNDLERMKSQLALFKSVMGVDAPIQRAGKAFKIYRDHILAKKVDFIFEIDPLAECKKIGEEINSDNAYMINLFKNVRNTCASMSAEEKLHIADLVLELYKDYLEYVVVS
jgi:hypothetical protein